jgi:hypothetical protein
MTTPYAVRIIDADTAAIMMESDHGWFDILTGSPDWCWEIVSALDEVETDTDTHRHLRRLQWLTDDMASIIRRLIAGSSDAHELHCDAEGVMVTYRDEARRWATDA